ncbi:YCF1, partial [Symbiodinium microadriaticum]
MRKLARVAHEWKTPFYIVKIDIAKAFDSIAQEKLGDLVMRKIAHQGDMPWEARLWLRLLEAFHANRKLLCSRAPVKDWHIRTMRKTRALLHQHKAQRWSTHSLQMQWQLWGHIGRATFQPTFHILRWRDLTWWRDQQSLPPGPGPKGVRHIGHHNPHVDPERQISAVAGNQWWITASDRPGWQTLCKSYVAAYDPPWASGKQLALPGITGPNPGSEIVTVDSSSESDMSDMPWAPLEPEPAAQPRVVEADEVADMNVYHDSENKGSNYKEEPRRLHRLPQLFREFFRYKGEIPNQPQEAGGAHAQEDRYATFRIGYAQTYDPASDPWHEDGMFAARPGEPVLAPYDPWEDDLEPPQQPMQPPQMPYRGQAQIPPQHRHQQQAQAQMMMTQTQPQPRPQYHPQQQQQSAQSGAGAESSALPGAGHFQPPTMDPWGFIARHYASQGPLLPPDQWSHNALGLGRYRDQAQPEVTSSASTDEPTCEVDNNCEEVQLEEDLRETTEDADVGDIPLHEEEDDDLTDVPDDDLEWESDQPDTEEEEDEQTAATTADKPGAKAPKRAAGHGSQRVANKAKKSDVKKLWRELGWGQKPKWLSWRSALQYIRRGVQPPTRQPLPPTPSPQRESLQAALAAHHYSYDAQGRLIPHHPKPQPPSQTGQQGDKALNQAREDHAKRRANNPYLCSPIQIHSSSGSNERLQQRPPKHRTSHHHLHPTTHSSFPNNTFHNNNPGLGEKWTQPSRQHTWRKLTDSTEVQLRGDGVANYPVQIIEDTGGQPQTTADQQHDNYHNIVGDPLVVQPAHITDYPHVPGAASSSRGPRDPPLETGGPPLPDISDLQQLAAQAIAMCRAPAQQVDGEGPSMRSSVRVDDNSHDISWVQKITPATLPPPMYWLVEIDFAPPPVPDRMQLSTGTSFWLEWKGEERHWQRRPRFPNDIVVLGGFPPIPSADPPRPPTPPQRRDPTMAQRSNQQQQRGFNPQNFVDQRPLRGRLIQPTASSSSSSSRTPESTSTATDDNVKDPDRNRQPQTTAKSRARTEAKPPPLPATAPGSESETSWPSEDPPDRHDSNALLQSISSRASTAAGEADITEELVLVQTSRTPTTTSPENRSTTRQHAAPVPGPEEPELTQPAADDNAWFSVAANFDGEYTVQGLLRLLHRILHEMLQQSFALPSDYLTSLAYHACYYVSKLQSTNDRNAPAAAGSGGHPGTVNSPPTAMVFSITNAFVEAEVALESIVQHHGELPRRHLLK